MQKGKKFSKETKINKRTSATLGQILKYATNYDYLFIFIGIFGSALAGVNWPLLNITFGKVVGVFVKFEHRNSNQTEINDEIRDIFMKDVYYWSGLTFISFILFVIGNLLTLYSFQLLAFNLTNNIKRKYFHSIITQELAWHDQRNSGEFAARIASDFKKFENGFNENLGLLIYNVVGAVMNLIIGFYYGWKLSLAIVAMAPLIVITSFVMTKFQSHYTQKELSAYSSASSVAEEAISAIRTVFAFSGQYKELKRYETRLHPAMIYGFKRNIVNAIGNSINWATLYVSFAVGLWYGVKLIISPIDIYTIDDIVIIFWGITGCGYNIGYAAPFYESFQIGKTSAKSIMDILERQSKIDSMHSMGKTLRSNFKTDIEFKNVHFHYPTRPGIQILQGLNLKIKSDEIVALVGPSGCGKSTIIQLIQRYYDPDCGEILLNGVNTRDIHTGWLRGQLGVVGQEPVLFETSIAENIRLGMPFDRMNEITQTDIERAAKEANAHEFISKLPNGYDTYVGDRGKQLSGGQKQRIAIARALISNPKILLLDEATSALDLESEHIVQEALDHASKGRTTIIIAHRLSTIKNADRILYIEQGRLVEQGTHQHLMELKNKYFNLVMAQQIEPHEPVPPKKQPLSISQSSTLEVRTLQQKRRATNSQFDSLTSPSRPIPVSRTRTLTYENVVRQKGGTIGSENGSVYNDDEEITKEDLEKLEKNKFPHKRLFKLIWIDKFYFLIAFIAALIYGLSTPIYAFIFGEFVQLFTIYDIKLDSDFIQKQTNIYAMYFLILAIAILICCIIQISLFGIVGEKLTKRLRIMAYSAILQQEITFFDNPENSPGALCARLANDAANVQGATGLRVSMICQALSTLIVSVIMGFMCNWRLSLVSMTLLPLIAISSLISSSAYSSQTGSENESSEKSSKIIIEVINSIRTVVSLHKEEYFLEKFEDTLMKKYRSYKWKCFIKASMISFSLGVQFFAYTIVFLYGGFLISKGLLDSGDFFKIVESMIWGAVVVGQSAVLSSDYTKAKIAAMNIFMMIDRKPIKDLIPAYLIQEKFKNQGRSDGKISLRGVYFHYPLRPNLPILNGLSFKASKGEKVALVGSSGCGKSTTIQILERFYDCVQGKVFLDDKNIAELDVDWLRSQMALVSQEPILFSHSIRDNIAYGDNFRETVPFDEIVHAAQMANIHDFIKNLPQGYDTPVGSKGTQLSGGQKQRIAIARALVRDPPILLLDEATSALDTGSEQIVQDALDQAAKGRTCITIAHRLKTIVHSDKIVVLHKGQNVEEGTHDELIAMKKNYWKLHNSGES
ncbi:ATP-dependent translocase ABCB1-like [Dermatophagoides pteronyssinus]|uniref:ATP-dependent translocase ABCB1-like n=1 Tax=Dermatophagoides pteronyssinus TaxID=6956 RepID=UPI003F6719CF